MKDFTDMVDKDFFLVYPEIIPGIFGLLTMGFFI